MSDEGEKTCPLCAEEMDLTDQQLKPCKCGYEICVWCWHHIMDMAEKDESEGRCPACRVPYDKEKIVGMAAKCERLVAEVHMERKMKSQKAKAKSSEGRKQLSSVRVIQRNLVYIVGLPLNLADEELLQHREYFGQYGKVLKVSISRTAAGVIQQYQNNTCSVYITYSKEDEAIRCIQNVHGFVLDGRSLRACFGTTKYCHAWLRNVPCTNPDCLYLHEVGSQEDSFTKDEIISAYTRSRVQQITGAANNVQRRSGNVLPPPLDDYCNNSSASSGKPIVKNGSNNVGNIAKGSPPNGSTGRSIALPAAASWGMRGSNCHPLAANLTCTNGLPKQKPETVSNTLAFSSAVAGTAQTSITHGDGGKIQSLVEEGQNIDAIVKPETLKPVKQHNNLDSQSSMPEKSAGLDEPPSVNLSNQFSCPPVSCPPVSRDDDDRGISMPPSISNNPDRDRQSSSSGNEKELFITSEGRVQNLCSEISSLCIDRNVMDEHSGKTTPSSAFSDHSLNKSPVNQGLQQYYCEHSREPSTISQKLATSVNEVSGSRDQPDWISDSQTQVMPNTSSELEEDIISFDNQRLKDPEVVSRSTYLPNSTSSFHTSNHSCSPFQQHEAYAAVNSNPDRLFVDNKFRESSFLGASTTSLTSNGYPNNLAGSYIGSERTSEHSFLHLDEDTGKHLRRFLGDAANTDVNSVVDKGESSIISNILSLDFDTWDESLASPQNFAKLLGDDDKQSGSHRLSSSWKVQTNNQSRFSFARQEDSVHQAFDVRPSHNIIGQLSNNHPYSHNFAENRDLYFDKLGLGNGFSSSSFEESENQASNHSAFPSNKLSVSRAQISAPPGFSVPSRAPPPGFASHVRLDQTFDSLSGNRLLDTSSLLRNAYQSQVTGNMGSTADIEFMDPAILAVGKGRLQGGLNNPALEVRPNFPSQLGSFENDARLQLLMSRSLSPQQNLRFPDIGDSFSHFSDSYGIPSRLVDQSQVNNLSPFAQMSIRQSRNGLMSNGHWDGWSEVQGGNTGMAELLRNERLGYNKFYAGYEDSKFRMPSSGDLYNRTFGM